eukprot:5490946-Pyramimonas_sp.AAC.1
MLLRGGHLLSLRHAHSISGTATCSSPSSESCCASPVCSQSRYPSGSSTGPCPSAARPSQFPWGPRPSAALEARSSGRRASATRASTTSCFR